MAKAMAIEVVMWVAKDAYPASRACVVILSTDHVNAPHWDYSSTATITYLQLQHNYCLPASTTTLFPHSIAIV